MPYPSPGQEASGPVSVENPMNAGMGDTCADYLCIDWRCRSCQSDAECRPGSTCNRLRDMPGRTCRDAQDDDPDILDRHPRRDDPAPPAPRVCPKTVVTLPDRPLAQRLPPGEACSLDTDCRSIFCDRGICGDPYGKGNFGRECVPGPSPPTEMPDPRDPHYPGMEIHMTPYGQNVCTGYLCMDGRCRSCTSDAECQREGSGGPRCLEYPNWWGKRCGTIEEVRALTFGIGQSPQLPLPAPALPPSAPPSSSPPPKP